jgi:hypothetical protein
MGQCARCDGFTERLNISAPREYANLGRQLQQIVGEGTFDIVRADVPLAAIENQDWQRDDMITHVFRCTACGRVFELKANTYHGGTRWRCCD